MVQTRAELSTHALSPGMTSVAFLSGQMTYLQWVGTAKPPLLLEGSGLLPHVVCAGSKGTPSERAHKARTHEATFDVGMGVSVLCYVLCMCCRFS